MSNANKTLPQPEANVKAMLDKVQPDELRKDRESVCEIMRRISGEKGMLWGDTIVGFGTYHYVYATGREGEWMRMGLAPRAHGLSLYLACGACDDYAQELSGLGKYKMGKACLNIRTLADVNMKVLEQILAKTWRILKEQYPLAKSSTAKPSNTGKRKVSKKTTPATKATQRPLKQRRDQRQLGTGSQQAAGVKRKPAVQKAKSKSASAMKTQA